MTFLTGSQIWNLFSWIYLCYQACKWLIHDSCPNKYKKIWHWWCLWKRSLKGPVVKENSKTFIRFKVFWHAKTKKLPNDDNFCYRQNLLIPTYLQSNLLSSYIYYYLSNTRSFWLYLSRPLGRLILTDIIMLKSTASKIREANGRIHPHTTHSR